MRSRLRVAANEQSQGNWKEWLRKWNRNGSPHLNWSEFKVMCQKGLKLLDDEMQLMLAFQSLDNDNSGEVTMDEIIDFIQADDEGEKIKATEVRSQTLVEEPDMGELRIDIEYHNEEGNFHHAFEVDRYEKTAHAIREELQRELGGDGMPFEVRLNPGPPASFKKYYDMPGWFVHARTAEFRQRSRWAVQPPKLVQYPRLGSFEVTVRLPAPVKRARGAYEGLPRQFEAWSKIKRKKWPKEGWGEWLARRLLAARAGEEEAVEALLAPSRAQTKEQAEERPTLDDPGRYRRLERNPPMFMSTMPRVSQPPAPVVKPGSRDARLPVIQPARLPEGAMDRLRARLKGAAYNVGGRDWAKLFREQDRDRSGCIGWEEFRKMCRRVLKLTDQEAVLRALFLSLDADGSGSLEIEELVAYVQDPIARMSARLKSAAEARAEGQGGKTWVDQILEADKDGSGQLDWLEFRTMCRKTLKLLDSNDQLKGVFSALDGDGSGEISVDELIEFVKATKPTEALRSDHQRPMTTRAMGGGGSKTPRPGSSPPPKRGGASAEISKVRARLKGAAYTLGGKDWTRLFYEQDADESGQMDWAHFRVFCRSVLKLSDELDSLRKAFDGLDRDGVGEVSIQEIVDFVSEGPVSVDACMEVLGKAEWASQQHYDR